VKPAVITIRAKVLASHYSDGTLAKRYVQLPKLQRAHCDMQAFRDHPRFGAYANSDLFAGMLARIRKEIAGDSGQLNLAKLPENVTVDTSGFLAVVTISV
jgi:hypothetical protein